VIYLDSSAVLKLVTTESESDALENWLVERREASVVSSALTQVEVLRACRRIDEGLLPAARRLLRGIDLVPMDSSILDTAAELPTRVLRSQDALHVASALSLETDLEAFVAYDARLVTAAEAAGLAVVRPGA
jgi:predicted nucleic acid-binding protein